MLPGGRVPAWRRDLNSGGKSYARQHAADRWILVLTATLLGFGLIVIYSISPGLAASQGSSQSYFVVKQLAAVILAGIGFLLASRIPTSWWESRSKWLIYLAVAASFVVMIIPLTAAYPAHRWVRLGSFSFQVAELVKLALVITTAKYLSLRWRLGQLKDSSKTLYPLVGLLLGLGIVVAKLQSDLGSFGVMVAILGVMAYVAGLPLKRVAVVGGLVVALAFLAIVSSGYRRERFSTYLHQGSNCQSSGYQSCQALISVGSGGLSGLGLGYSVQAYGYLPEPSNDSIFAIIAEKFGFIGTLVLLAVYISLIDRLRRVAERTIDQFARLVVVGVMVWLSVQMVINVGAMIGLLPLKGITLPLVSQGGTSIVFLAVALGIIFQISRYTSYQEVEPSGNETNKTNDDPHEWGRHRRTPRAITYSRPRA